jgi:hypothetical protein
MTADACIEGYPDRNVPTLLLYHDGSLQSQIVGLAEFGGPRVTKDTVEWVLSRRGVCETEIEDDLGRQGERQLGKMAEEMKTMKMKMIDEKTLKRSNFL